jgi:hypothetical protein
VMRSRFAVLRVMLASTRTPRSATIPRHWPEVTAYRMDS